jgi:hypothetical protein
MRKWLFALALVVSIHGFVSAQGWRSYGQSVAVTGTLGLQSGRITVLSDGRAYFVPSLERYIGFIEGLKEGATVSLEGYVSGNGGYAHLRLVKMTINGKDYDFSPMSFSAGRPTGDWCRGGGYGRGHRWG